MLSPSLLILSAISLELLLGRVGVLPLRLSLAWPFFRLGRWCERRLNRRQRSARARLIRGVLVMGLMILLALLGASLTHLIAHHMPVPRIVDLIMLMLCLSLGRRWRVAARVAKVVRAKNHQQQYPTAAKKHLTRGLRRAKRALGCYSRRDMAVLDGHSMCRMAVEVIARAVDRGFLAPIFWYLVAGHHGLWLLAMAIGVARSVGMLGPHIEDFGLVAARCEHVMMLIPAWFGMVFWRLILCCRYRDRAKAAYAAMHQKISPMIEAPDRWLCGFFAGILDLALIGPRSEARQAIQIPWLGTGTARVMPEHVRAATSLVLIQGIFWAMIVGMPVLLSIR